MKDAKKSQYLWALFLLGISLLNYPVLAIYNVPKWWLGVPLLYLLVFLIWALMIVLTFIIVKSRGKADV